jgi:hypothetical protein
VNRSNNKIINRNKDKHEEPNDVHLRGNPKWVTFTFHSPLIWKVTNILKNTNLHIAVISSNTLNNLLSLTTHTDEYRQSGVYKLKCNTCERAYVGPSGRQIHVQFKEHHRYIKQNNAKSAYALHILNNQHELGPMMHTMRLLKPRSKGWKMNACENYFMQWYHSKDKLINEQCVHEPNPLFTLTFDYLPTSNI